MSPLEALRSRAADELARNERLRWMLYCVAALLVIYALLVVRDLRVDLEGEARSGADRLAKLREVTQQSGWEAYAAAQKDRGEQALKRFWDAESEGVAKAGIQSALEAMLASQGVIAAHIAAESVVDPFDDRQRIKVMVTLGGDYNSQAFYGLLRELENSERLLVVEFLEIYGDPQRHFTMSVAGWALTPAGGGG